MKSKFEINAFFEKFSFILKGAKPLVEDKTKVEDVSIEKFSESLMTKEPCYDGATGALVGIDDDENYHLINEKGEVFYTVKQNVHVIHNEAHCDNESYDGETVGEAILQAGVPMWVVCIHTGYDVVDHHSVGGHSVKVYTQSCFDIKSWLNDKKEEAKQAIAAY